MKWISSALLGLAILLPLGAQEGKPDPYLWLESINGDKALAWVHERNAETGKALAASDSFKALESGILQILDYDPRISPFPKHGAFYYSFRQDARNPRGLWLRLAQEQFRKLQPKWEVVLDIDALGKAERESWVFKGAAFLKPAQRRCLIMLSRGGSDAHVVREFDVETKAFVSGGFQLPRAKSQISWIDEDTIFVGTDFGPGSLTTSGYPRLIKRWKRGTPLSQARTVFEAKATDMESGAFHEATPGFERDFLVRRPTFFSSETFLLAKDGSRKKLDVPADAKTSTFREWLLVRLRTPWSVGGRTYPEGSLLAARFDDFMAGKRDLTLLFQPTATAFLTGFSRTRHHLILNVLDDVKNRLLVLTPQPGPWKQEPLQGAPPMGNVSVSGVDADESDDYFMEAMDFLTPPTLYFGTLGKAPEKFRESRAFFNTSSLEISQHFTKSKDGTRIPYFQVSARGLKLDGSHPTLLTGYGGLERSQLPHYSAVLGWTWLSRGGVYVLANIRGGGEYGPKWHQAATKRNRPRAYEDFAAVAQDLAIRGVCSAKHLGIVGASNGGLLVGNMLTRYPQLFGAVVCQSPVLDMKRYSHLLAGASWIEEYGDPDKPEEWKYLKTFSPYQNLRAGVNYPPTLFMSSTLDDRVHPAHARKMMAKMRAMGLDVHYFENIEGGHASGAEHKQSAHFWALAYIFLWQTLQ